MSRPKNILYILYSLLWIIDLSYSTNINTTNIVCSTEDDCFISCSSTNNCNHKSIRCPSDNLHRCHIICENPQSCKDTIIFANNSQQLNIICNTQHSCSGMTVHCPYVYSTNQQKQHNKLCIFNIKQNTNSDVTIYANYGWKTIRLLNYTQYNTTFTGILSCKSNIQSDICQFDLTQSLQCINPYHQCNTHYTTTQIFQPTVSNIRTSISTSIQNKKSQSTWDTLKSIHILWWIILLLMISIICLICFLLIYMRIQNSVTKQIAEAHRISQVVSNKYTASNVNSPSTTMGKLKSLSEEKTSETVTHIPLQLAKDHTQLLQKQFSVPTHYNNTFNNNNTIPLKRSQSYSNNMKYKYKSNIEMNNMNINIQQSDHSRVKTLTFKPRKEDVPSMPVNISNTTTTTNINSSNSNHSSPQYNSTNESETLSIVSVSSKGSIHNNIHSNNNYNNSNLNKFYPQRSDSSNQYVNTQMHNVYSQQQMQQIYNHNMHMNLQRHKSQYAQNNYNNYNQNTRLHRGKSCPQPHRQRQPQQQPQPQPQRYPIPPQLTYNNKPPLKPTILNIENKEEEEEKIRHYTEMNKNNLRLQQALQNLAEEKKNNNNLTPVNKHEVTDTLWTDTSMIDAKSVLALDNQPSGGIVGMLPGMFGNNDININDNDNSKFSNIDSNGSDNHSIDSSDSSDNSDDNDDTIDRSY